MSADFDSQMEMKPFRFQQFTVHQHEDVFRVGTDAVLLGSLCGCGTANEILEIGTGTGIISLMIAQRNQKANIVAIDLDGKAIELAHQNFSQSIFSSRLQALQHDFRNFSLKKKFDCILSNPPYFEENHSSKDRFARQKINLNFEELLHQVAAVLHSKGLFSVILPAESASQFCQIATEVGLFLKRKVMIFGIDGGPLRRVIMEFTFHHIEVEIIEFTIEKNPRNYSDQYLDATKDFHLFSAK